MAVNAPIRRSPDQRLAALKRANKVRARRAQMKADLRAGRTSAAGLIEFPPSWLASMRLRVLLLALPKMGPTKVDRLLVVHRISHSKTVGGLSDRQRRELVAALGSRRA